ncbi:ribulokinase [Viridibacillus arvi]|uniref:ribulokinase n=1 Tax=Viridibacillus arvi TaxID=263475 RepID=UPI003CFCA65E
MNYVIGIDFGSESGRAVLVDSENGDIIKVAEMSYPNGVLTKSLNGKPLKANMVLQNPNDYVEVLTTTVRSLLEETKVDPNYIKGMGVAFTSCTCLPVDQQLSPLCSKELYADQPHAYAKLWKSHSAEKEAQFITEKLADHPYLEKYGGVISSEWLMPKLLEILNDTPSLFEKMDYFLEAGDWIVSLLTGNVSRSTCSAGYKGLWQKKDGHLDKEILQSIHPSLADVYTLQLRGAVIPVGSSAGTLTPYFANLLGLSEHTTVGASIIDAHAAVPGAGIYKPGILQIVMGTSSCHLLLSEQEISIPGISGVVEDGILPGLYAYEAGQVAVGDIFASFIKHQVPAYYTQESKERNLTLFQLLNAKAEALEAGATGMVALDWHNGNRTPYVNSNFSGVFVGETLQTEAHEKYRTLLEATAFGTKVIVDLFEEKNIDIHQIVVTGGIPKKNPFLMQIYADVLQKEILVVDHHQIPALGAAILGAAAARDKADEKYSLNSAIQKIGFKDYIQYSPNKKNEEIYNKLYGIYRNLSHYFSSNEDLLTLHTLKTGREMNNGTKFMESIK